MNFFFKPRPGVIGDTIPFFHDGRYHVFYLRDHRDPDSYGIGSAWHHISTLDFVHWDKHQEALAQGPIDAYDLTVATGCVFTGPDSTHHIFYTGINPYLRTPDSHSQVILHATSNDLMTWTKHPDDAWYPDESVYERHDWRDPFVFIHPETGRYTMLVASRLNHGPVHRRGCTAVLTSDDLQTWTIGPAPFYAPERYHGHECPDWFQMGDWYYLVFSEYTTHTVTRYVMSRSPDGPWITPADNQFDNRAHYAAKTASDGTRRFLFGWNPSKVGDLDHNEWQWGGCLTVHEIVQRADGTLAVRMPPEVRAAFTPPEPLSLQPQDAGWESGSGIHQATSPYRYTAMHGNPMPETYLIEGEITFDEPGGTAGLLLKLDQTGDSGYFLRFNHEDQRLELGKIGGYRDWYVDRMPELDRPLSIEPGIPIRFTVIVDKTAVVAWVNDDLALSGRIYDNPFGRCGLFADGASVTFHEVASGSRQDPS